MRGDYRHVYTHIRIQDFPSNRFPCDGQILPRFADEDTEIIVSGQELEPGLLGR